MAWTISQALMEAYENSHSSQEEGAESLEGNSLDGKPSVPSSGSHTPHLYSQCDKMTAFCHRSQSGMTCKPSTGDLGEDVLTWYLEGFPAKTYPLQEKEQGLMVNAPPCGHTWRELSMKFDLNTHLWKTHQCLWEEDLQESSVTLPRSGMMRGGLFWERITSEPHTRGIASGLSPNGETFFHTPVTTGMDGGSNSRKALKKKRAVWQTPTVTQIQERSEESWEKKSKSRLATGRKTLPPGTLQEQINISRPGDKVRPSLDTMARKGMFPAPTSSEHKYRLKGNSQQSNSLGALARKEALSDGGTQTQPPMYATPRVGGEESFETVFSRKGADVAKTHNTLASVEYHHGESHTFPTPGTTGMSNGSGNCEKANKLHSEGVISEEERKSMRAGNGGQLSPLWVEWLMGWPIGWTDLKPLGMDKFRLWLRLHGKS